MGRDGGGHCDLLLSSSFSLPLLFFSVTIVIGSSSSSSFLWGGLPGSGRRRKGRRRRRRPYQLAATPLSLPHFQRGKKESERVFLFTQNGGKGNEEERSRHRARRKRKRRRDGARESRTHLDTVFPTTQITMSRRTLQV